MKIHDKKINYTSFQAKFIHSESLKDIAEYAVGHGKFNRLNTARKNIDNAYLTTRLKVDIFEKDGKSGINFSRYIPKPAVITPKTYDDYILEKVTTYENDKNLNPLKFALEKIIKLGNNAPHNNMYEKVVIKK